MPVLPAPSLCNLVRTSCLASLNLCFFICRIASTTYYRVSENVYSTLNMEVTKKTSFLLPFLSSLSLSLLCLFWSLFLSFSFLCSVGKDSLNTVVKQKAGPELGLGAQGLKSWPNTVIKERNKKEGSRERPLAPSMWASGWGWRLHCCEELNAFGEGKVQNDKEDCKVGKSERQVKCSAFLLWTREELIELQNLRAGSINEGSRSIVSAVGD